MTDLEQIRLWEKEEAATRMRALGKCRCQDCKNWNPEAKRSCKCVFWDVQVTNKRGVLVRKYWVNTPGHWRNCDRYETRTTKQ